MTSPRLELQFIRLWQAFEGKETETTLQELAETLHCTRRHVRSLLNKMVFQLICNQTLTGLDMAKNKIVSLSETILKH